jgi:hypothetical protein
MGCFNRTLTEIEGVKDFVVGTDEWFQRWKRNTCFGGCVEECVDRALDAEFGIRVEVTFVRAWYAFSVFFEGVLSRALLAILGEFVIH